MREGKSESLKTTCRKRQRIFNYWVIGDETR